MLDTTDFNILFEKFRNQKILVIGDVMIDTYPESLKKIALEVLPMSH